MWTRCRDWQQSQQGERQAASLSPCVLVLLTGDRRIDARAAARHLGVSKNRLRLATEEEVAAVTGFEVGSVPPFGESRVVTLSLLMMMMVFMNLLTHHLLDIAGKPSSNYSTAV